MRLSVFTALLASFVFFGCTTASPIRGPDGTEHQLVKCGQIESCYEKATEVCGGKYRIVNSTSETSGADGNTSTALKLLVKCEK